MELERRLAAFKKVEAVVVFQSGFAANAGTVSAVLDQGRRRHLRRAESREHHRRLPPEPRDDQGVPAQGRRRRAQDPQGAAGRPAQAAHHRRRVQHGRRPRRRCRSCARSPRSIGCIMMVDDAHASGVFGKNGRGTIDHFGMHGRVDIQVGTLSKAIGALGGYVAGNANADRVPVPPRAAVPVLDLASAGGRRRVHRGARRARSRSRRSSSGCGTTRVSSRRDSSARLQHRPEREPDHAGDRRRRRAGDEAVGPAVRGGRVRAGHRASRPSRATRRACARSSRRRTRARSCSSRSTRSRRSAGSSA